MIASGGTEAHDQGWESGRVPLKFQLGGILLGKAILCLLRRSAHLDEDPLAAAEVPEPPADLAGAHGYVVWSHPLAQRMERLAWRNGSLLYAPHQYLRHSIDLTGSYEEYLAKFSARTRSQLKRKLRKFTETSGTAIDWREYRAPEEVEEFFRLARIVSAKTYQERRLGMGLPESEAFIVSMRASAERDEVRAYLLFLRGTPISYLYCPLKAGVLRYGYLGYDPKYASLSPGIVLQILVLEALFKERDYKLFDFTEGEGRHKEMFSTQSCLCGDIYVLRPGFYVVATILLHNALDRVSAFTGSTLDRLGLKARIREFIRMA